MIRYSLITTIFLLSSILFANEHIDKIVKIIQSGELSLENLKQVDEQFEVQKNREFALEAAYLYAKKNDEELAKAIRLEFIDVNFANFSGDYREKIDALKILSAKEKREARLAILMKRYKGILNEVKNFDLNKKDSVLAMGKFCLGKNADAPTRKGLADIVVLADLRYGYGLKSFRAQAYKALKHDCRKILKNEELYEDCEKCTGTGKLGYDCPRCDASGKCTNDLCRKGFVMYKGLGSTRPTAKKCHVCKGKQVCRDCKGEKLLYNPCKPCKTKGKLVNESGVEKLMTTNMNKLLVRLSKLSKGESLSKPKPKPKPVVSSSVFETEEDAGVIEFSEEEIKEPGSTANYLKLAAMEVTDKIAADVRRGNVAIANELYAQPTLPWGENSKHQLFLLASDDFLALDDETKETLVDGYLKFWAKRISSNGISGPVQILVLDADKEILYSQEK